MRSSARIFLLSLAVLAACSVPRQPDLAPAAADPRTPAERQVLELVNSYRVGRGLPVLRRDPHLSRVARDYSEAAARGEYPFNHDGLDDRARRVGERISFLSMGENLYSRQPASRLSGWYAVTGWLESPSHLAIIEGCFDLTGVGMAADSAGRVYYTQLFVLTARRSLFGGAVTEAPRGEACR